MVSIVGDEVLMVKENVYGTIRYTLPKRMSLHNYEGHEELENGAKGEEGLKFLNELK